MDALKRYGLWPSGRFFRRGGISMMYWSIALAAFIADWQAPFLFGMFLLGLGIGLGNWEASPTQRGEYL